MLLNLVHETERENLKECQGRNVPDMGQTQRTPPNVDLHETFTIKMDKNTTSGDKSSLKTCPARAERAALAVTMTTEHCFPSKGLFLFPHTDNAVVLGAFGYFY